MLLQIHAMFDCEQIHSFPIFRTETYICMSCFLNTPHSWSLVNFLTPILKPIWGDLKNKDNLVMHIAIYSTRNNLMNHFLLKCIQTVIDFNYSITICIISFDRVIQLHFLYFHRNIPYSKQFFCVFVSVRDAFSRNC